MFSNIYRLKTVEQSNDLGSWHGFTCDKESPTPLEIARLALSFMKAARSGEVQVKQDALSDEESDEDIPF